MAKIIYLNGVIDNEKENGDISLAKLQNDIGNEKDIKIYLNSNGGSVVEGEKIYDYLVQIQEEGVKINIIVNGSCYSMASVILCSVPLENRKITENADIMLHYPLTEVTANSFKLKEVAEEMEVWNKWFINLYQKRTKINTDKLKELLINETRINSKQAVEFGIVSNQIETIKAVAFLHINKNKINEKKMNVIEKLTEAISLLTKSRAEETTTVQAIEMIGADGMKIVTEAETLEVGATVQVYENETLVESFTGDITLENGSIIKIEANVIMEITEEIIEDVEALKAELEALKAENTELKTAIENTTAKISEFNTAIGKPMAIVKKQVFVKNIEKKENEISEAQALILERANFKINKLK